MTDELATIPRTDAEAPSHNGTRAEAHGVGSPVVGPPGDRWTMLWRAKVWIVLAAVVVGLGTYVVSKKIAPVYSSSIVVRVAAPSPAGVSPNEIVLASNNLAAEFAQLSKTTTVLDPAAAQARVAFSALRTHLTASVLANQNLIQIAVQSSSPSGAVAGATAVAKSLETYVNGLSVSATTSDAQRLQSLDAQILSLTAQIQTAQADADAAVQAAAAARTGSAAGSAALAVATQRENYLTQLGLQRSTLQAQRQGFVSSAPPSNASVIPMGAASGAGQVQPKPTLYAAVALIVAALAAAQLAVFIGSRRHLRIAVGRTG